MCHRSRMKFWYIYISPASDRREGKAQMLEEAGLLLSEEWCGFSAQHWNQYKSFSSIHLLNLIKRPRPSVPMKLHTASADDVIFEKDQFPKMEILSSFTNVIPSLYHFLHFRKRKNVSFPCNESRCIDDRISFLDDLFLSHHMRNIWTHVMMLWHFNKIITCFYIKWSLWNRTLKCHPTSNYSTEMTKD